MTPEDAQTILRLSPVWIITSPERRFLELSPLFLESLGYREEELVGRYSYDFIHPDDLERTRLASKTLNEGGTIAVITLRYRCKSGAYRWLEFNCLANPDGQRRFSVGRDITEERQLKTMSQLTRKILQRQASEDHLTGALNRRMFAEHAPREMARSTRHHRPLSLVALDLDHFKRVNDGYGHEAGDAILKVFADTLRSSIRSEDFLFRMGGEEFTLLLVECSPDGAETRAMAALEMRKMVGTVDGRALPRVTASAGVATYPDSAIDLDELQRHADLALYASKHGGRDMVTAAPGVAWRRGARIVDVPCSRSDRAPVGR